MSSHGPQKTHIVQVLTCIFQQQGDSHNSVKEPVTLLFLAVYSKSFGLHAQRLGVNQNTCTLTYVCRYVWLGSAIETKPKKNTTWVWQCVRDVPDERRGER